MASARRGHVEHPVGAGDVDPDLSDARSHARHRLPIVRVESLLYTAQLETGQSSRESWESPQSRRERPSKISGLSDICPTMSQYTSCCIFGPGPRLDPMSDQVWLRRAGARPFLQRLRHERPGHRPRARGHQYWWRIDLQRDRSGTQIQRVTHHHHSGRCVGGERPCHAQPAAARRSRRQSLPAGERRCDHPARGGATNGPTSRLQEISRARAPWPGP